MDDAERILEDATPVGCKNVYAISSAGRGPSNVASQQRRALNLVWALNNKGPTPKDRNVWVFGAGAAGLTCAAALTLLGSKVTLFDRVSEPMHFQKGCHHRFLHPRIVDWPKAHSTMVSANLPILNWFAETADHVRGQILSGYAQLMGARRGVVKIGKFNVSLDGSVEFVDPVQVPKDSRPDLVILALGFGVEKTLASLPRLSYWRLDSLDQPALDTRDDPRRILVCGDGDGGAIDFLRASLLSFDHGPFLQHVCDLLDGVRSDIEDIEAEASTQKASLAGADGLEHEAATALSRWLWTEYQALPEARFEALDGFLKQELRGGVEVCWTGRSPTPFPPRTQPLHRLLAWRLVGSKRDAFRSFSYRQLDLTNVALLDQSRSSGPFYEATLRPPGKRATAFIEPFHLVIYRGGPENELERALPHLHERLPRRLAVERPDEELRPEAAELFGSLAAQWPQPIRPTPELRVEVVRKFESMAWKGRGGLEEHALSGYHLRLYLINVDPAVERVTYVRHSDPDRGPIRSRALRGFNPDRAFALPLFTWDDYDVEVWIGEQRLAPQALVERLVAQEAAVIPGVRQALVAGRAALRSEDGSKLREALRAHAHRDRTASLALRKEQNLEA